ncbi:MAG: hypothetical protein RLY66_441 [Candidatus Parcubacteria bacterium]|jgi:Tfp pilus assembly protein PilV
MIYSSKKNPTQGMILIEVVIYTVLLSFLIAGTINFLYSIQMKDASLLDDINYAQQN